MKSGSESLSTLKDQFITSGIWIKRLIVDTNIDSQRIIGHGIAFESEPYQQQTQLNQFHFFKYKKLILTFKLNLIYYIRNL